MTPSLQIVCEFALSFGIPMGLAVREYWSLGPGRGSLPPGEPDAPPMQPLPDAGSPIAPAGNRKLPDCLIPKPHREFA